MVYETLLLIGIVGLAAQALTGAHARGHGHAPHAHGVRGHTGHRHAHHAGHAHPHAAQTHATHHGHSAETETAPPAAATLLLGLLSPMALCGICVGTGAAGLLLPHWLHGALLVGCAAAAVGLAFWLLALRPLTEVLMRFASTPAATLTGAVAQEAIADSRFDEAGHGIVRVTVDGQITRLLATLDEPGAQVSSGDRLLVIAIDAKRNTCRVTPL